MLENTNGNELKLKRAVIKEELVALTGDFRAAILLNQFIYWSQRVYDFDQFIEEEAKIRELMTEEQREATTISELKQGWIYKKTEELAEEVMINMTAPTVRKYIKMLIENEWIAQRNNPKAAYDRTLQYRVNINKIQLDLFKLGYALEGYRLPSNLKPSPAPKVEEPTPKSEEPATPKVENEAPKVAESEAPATPLESLAKTIEKEGNSEENGSQPLTIINQKNLVSKQRNLVSKQNNFGAIPEITTKTTTESTNSVSQSTRRLEDEKETDRQTEELNNVLFYLKEIIKIDELKMAYPNREDILNEIELNIMEMFIAETTMVKGQPRPKLIVQSAIAKLNYFSVEDVMLKFLNISETTVIDNTKAYLQSMIYNAAFETNSAIKNSLINNGIKA